MSGLNGSNGQQVSLNPQDAARAALMFLARANFQRHERQAFDVADQFLEAVANGQLIVSVAPAAVEHGSSPQPRPQS